MLKFYNMIQLEEALKIVLENAYVKGTEQIDYTKSLGRVLAEDIASDINMPPFDKSAMDGYACRKEDISQELIVIETVRAGTVPEKQIGKDQCSNIMTGAIIPDGADCVIMVEYIEKTGENTIRFIKDNTRNNICYKGEDIIEGQVVLKKGEIVKSQHIAVMASVGCLKPLVFVRPKIGVLATGTEIVEPEIFPELSQIRNSNGPQMIAQLSTIGIQAQYYGIAGDSEEETYNLLEKSVKENDVTLLSGGVSMGTYDFVPEVLEKLGFSLLFHQLAIKPGKPTTFGVNGKKFVFGLPGNPVSSFNLFELLVKPFLYKLMDKEYCPPIVMLAVEKRIERKKSDRMAWFPGNITKNGTVRQIEYHGSAHIYALVEANCLIAIEPGQNIIESGELAYVRQI